MASVAHELRNPIHTFGMMLELCQDELQLLKQALQQVPLDQMPTTVLDTITGSMEELDNYIRDKNLPLSKSSGSLALFEHRFAEKSHPRST